MRSNDQSKSGRLTGWKEIAEHLGVNERTAQRWERENGLPVLRAEGQRSRVIADPQALDEWRHSGVPKPPLWSSLPFLRGYALAVSVLTLAGWGLFARRLATEWHLGPPATYRIDGSVLRVLDRKGHELWQHAFDSMPAPYQYAPDKIAQNLALADLDGDGRKELLMLYWHRQVDGPLTSTLMCFRDSGQVRWQFTPGKQIRDAQETFSSTYVLDKFAIVRSKSNNSGVLIATTSHHSVSYPCQIVILNRNGQQIGEYWHAGHLYQTALADLDGDGDEELLLGGVNNGYQQADLVVLDPRHLRGASAQPPGDFRQFQNVATGTEHAVVFFPRTELNERTEPFNFVMAIWQEGEAIQVTVREKRGNESGYVAYTLNKGLNLLQVTPSYGLMKLYEQFRATGHIRRDFLKDEAPRLRNIRVIRNHTGALARVSR